MAAPEAAVRSVGAGAYGTPVALRLAAEVGRPAGEVAGLIARRLSGSAVEGGFITVFVDPGTLVESIVADEGASFEGLLVGGWPDRPRTFDNPGFVVRYAYARAAAVRRRAADSGVTAGRPVLGHELEMELVGLLGGLHGWVERAVRERDAGALERQLVRVAEAYHKVYEGCPALPVDEEPGAVHRGRVTLAAAVQVAVGNGLRMLGETPRERI